MASPPRPHPCRTTTEHVRLRDNSALPHRFRKNTVWPCPATQILCSSSETSGRSNHATGGRGLYRGYRSPHGQRGDDCGMFRARHFARGICHGGSLRRNIVGRWSADRRGFRSEDLILLIMDHDNLVQESRRFLCADTVTERNDWSQTSRRTEKLISQLQQNCVMVATVVPRHARSSKFLSVPDRRN